MIRLNIGGKRFGTHKSTLMKFDGYFKNLLLILGANLVRPIFVDRSPEHFNIILNFMKDDRVDLPETLRDLKMLQKEARFYKLTNLCEGCEEEIERLERETELETLYEIIPTEAATDANNSNIILNNEVEV